MKKVTYKQRVVRWLCKGKRKITESRPYITRWGQLIGPTTIYSVNHQRVYADTLSMMSF